jgi:hypothetical protein
MASILDVALVRIPGGKVLKHKQILKILSAALLFLFAAQTPSYADTLLGSTVNVSAYYPDLSSLYTDAGNQVVGAGVEYPAGSISGYAESIDLSDTQIEVGIPVAVSFTPVTFNGFVITDLSGVFLSASYVSGVLPASISIAGNQLFLNYQGVSTSAAGNTIIDVTTNGVAATPLPAALPLFATGLAGLGLLGWRRKRKQVAA